MSKFNFTCCKNRPKRLLWRGRKGIFHLRINKSGHFRNILEPMFKGMAYDPDSKKISIPITTPEDAKNLLVFCLTNKVEVHLGDGEYLHALAGPFKLPTPAPVPVIW